ncbi:MAG: enolase C-terminal domain-like protein [Elusimicrobiota bacterium]
MNKISVVSTSSNFVREPLIKPFGFKGGYTTELWQTVALVRSSKGNEGIGLGTQSVLWSDAKVFEAHSESGGNALMYAILQYALTKARNVEWSTPIDLIDQILDSVYAYAKIVTNTAGLKLTFVLNALVPLDTAAWVLYARENGYTTFDAMVPEEYRPSLSARHEKVAGIPLITYALTPEDIEEVIRQGYFFMKIKIGADPEKDGDRGKMVEWDKQRLEQVHRMVKDIRIPYTENGMVPYYLDANGRYDTKDRLCELLDYAARIGAVEHIAIVEEPFPEEAMIDVTGLGVRIAADESAHSPLDVGNRINLGYTAIALKPIAKTLSKSLQIAELCRKKNVPCFCADLTVNPVMVEWNKNVAARLMPFPGLKIGLLESNGHQNYKNWQALLSYHPYSTAGWVTPKNGVYELDNSFYETSGGIFEIPQYYKALVSAT